MSLAVLNNDAIRAEVAEDLNGFRVNEYNGRQEKRLRQTLKSGISFIYDASVDRKWPTFKDWLSEYDYSYFIISLDLSEKLLTTLYKSKCYVNTDKLKSYIKDHDGFLSKYNKDIGMHINDKGFSNRLNISYNSVFNWMENIN